MIKLIILILIVILVILGGMYVFNIINGNQDSGNSNIDTAPSAEFTDLNNSDNVFNEIDSAIASLGQ